MGNDKKMILLVAEDAPDDQFLIRVVVESICCAGVAVQFVKDGMDLIAYLRQTGEEHPRPGLILLDLNMPYKDGREALKEIKAAPLLAEIPVVVMPTSRSEEDLRYCAECGAAGYYGKPNTIGDLETILSELCYRYLSE